MILLSRWNLTEPTAQIIQTDDLQAHQSKYFIRNADASITFCAPSSGEDIDSTANSAYPRSELRETLENGDDREANWSLDSAPLHCLRGRLRVDSLAASGKAIVGQFHGEGHQPPLKIQVTLIEGTDRFKVYMQHRPMLGGIEYKPSFAAEVALGEEFGYDARVTRDGALSVTLDTAAGAETLTARYDVASYASDQWYMKAGMYSQEAVGGVGTGQATFVGLLLPFHGTAEELAALLAQESGEQPAAGDLEQLVAAPSQDDVLVGTGADDILDGGAGRDKLVGAGGADAFLFSARADSHRTAAASFADLVQDFDPTQDHIDLSALGFAGFGDGRNGTLLVQTSGDATRTYLKSYEADAEGRRFEVVLDGDHAGAILAGGVVWLTREEANNGHRADISRHNCAIAWHQAQIDAHLAAMQPLA